MIVVLGEDRDQGSGKGMAEFSKDIVLRDINIWGKIMVLVSSDILIRK